MFDKIVLASGNAGKLKEFSRLFADLNIEVLPQSQFDTPECPEPYRTFVENALAKARHAAKHSGLPALADDSGICAAALNGAPGVLSARYAGANPKSDAANNKRLSDELAYQADKSCHYVCVLVLVRHENDPQPIIAEASGAANGRQKPQEPTVSATTRISSYPNTTVPPPSLTPKSKTPKATGGRLCGNC